MIWKWNFFLLAICTICADPLGTEGRGKEDGKGKEEMLFCYFHRHFIFHNTSLFFWKMFPLFSLHLYEPLHQSTSTLRFSSSNQEKETIKCIHGDSVFLPFHSRIRIVSIEFRKFSHLESSTSVLHMFSPHQLSDRYFLRPRTILHIAVT